MEIVSVIVSPIAESLMVPVKEHLGYWISCMKYVRAMGIKKRELDAIRLGIENHIDYNNNNNLEIPPEVSVWLKEVGEIDEKVEKIPSDVGCCFNLKVRHMLGRKAFKIIEEIKSLIEMNSTINWTNNPIPLGKVDSMKASTSTLLGHVDEFKSREGTFMKALKALQPNHRSHMIALCGMGGVGKTTMMQKIKNFVTENKLFDYVVEATIGEKTDPIAFQQAASEFLGVDLKETTQTARASKLRKSFEAISDGGKKRILVILDDVWQFVDMNHIGLSPMEGQSIDFKVLLTSRNRDVCTQMGVEVDSIFNVEVLTNLEAQNFFHQYVRSSDDANLDLDLRKIGDDIAIRCHGLPIAIKTIANTLKGKNKHVWQNALSCLEHHDNFVHQIFEISYRNLDNEETRSTLLLCVLFPEDFDIPTEDLVRYGWGLKLFGKVYTIRDARNKLNACIEKLIDANLLIQSQVVGCVKMHDLVRSFALDICSNGEHASVVDNLSTCSAADMSESCKRVFLTCRGTCEFPRGFNCPNLSLLKLIHEYKSLEFPASFYESTKKIQVIVYENIKYPLLPRSFQCSTNLRILCIHDCSLMFDFSSIGNLLNLEVLRLSNCRIRMLPSTFGNLKELKVLDLTGCDNLRIDDGVLKNLVRLEELYLKVANQRGIMFTYANSEELAECAKNLLTLEIEFFDNNDLPKNISFEKLERFKLSLGCYLKEDDGQNKHSFVNTLMLVSKKCELLDSRMDRLFEKTEVLHLEVDDVYDLGYGLVESVHQPSFHNLRVLNICKCANLKYLFTIHVARGLTKLERLTISQCLVLETLVDSESSGVEMIKFQALKFLSLVELPNLMSLCNVIIVIELQQLEELILDGLPNFTSIFPSKESTSSKSINLSTMQPFLNKEVKTSQLKILKIRNMEKLKEIWSSEVGNNKDVSFSKLKEIKVDGCDNLVYLFPSNMMLLLHHLEYIEVRNCGSIVVLFNIDLGFVGEMVEGSNRLRRICIYGLGKLRNVWRMKGVYNSNIPILGFQAVEYINIEGCKSLRNVFSPTTVDFDLRGVKNVTIDGIDGWGTNKSGNEMAKDSQKEEINVISNEDISEEDDGISNVAFPSYLIHTFNHLHKLHLKDFKGAEVVFNLESSSGGALATTRNNQQPLLLPYLKYIQIVHMEKMSHVWKYNCNNLFMSSFHNLMDISLMRCKHIKYLFSPLMAKLLSNLRNIDILSCDAMEEVVSNRYDEDEQMTTSISSDTITTFFPQVNFLGLTNLRCLKRIDGVDAKCGDNKSTSNITTTSNQDNVQDHQVNVTSWSLCQYSKKIRIRTCDGLLCVIPSDAAIGGLLKLEELEIYECSLMREIFEIEGVTNDVSHNTNVGDGSGETSTATAISRLTNMTLLQLPNLKRLMIVDCDLLKNIFTSSTLESLKKLEELNIERCKAIVVIVKEENGEHTSTSRDVVFPRLKSLCLVKLPSLKGFFLGKNDFKWPLLDTVKIYDCPQMTTFTFGNSMAPKLHNMHTGLGKHTLENGLNFDCTNASQENQHYDSSLCATPEMVKSLLQFPCSLSNLIEVDLFEYRKGNTIFPCNELFNLQKLEKSDATEPIDQEAHEVVEATNDDLMETQSVVRFSNQKDTPMYIWKSDWWRTSNLSNLTKIWMDSCSMLEYMFCYCMVRSLVQLQELDIGYCNRMEVIVKHVQDSEANGNEVVFPRLKSLNLRHLRRLQAIYLGMEAFQWPSLDTLLIEDCPQINVFTNGPSTTQKLKVIKTSFGLCEVTEEVNSFIRIKRQELPRKHYCSTNVSGRSCDHWLLKQS